MRPCRDTFLHFIADNLGGGISVHAKRCDPNDPAADQLQVNAVNIYFLDIELDQIAVETAVIDVINNDENTAVDWVTALWTILHAAYFTPLLDYTVPASPVPAGGNVIWDRKKIRFKRISKDDNYCHLSCVLPLRFTAA